MRYGVIQCKCGKQFYFETASNKVNCLQCEQEYDVSNYPKKTKE